MELFNLQDLITEETASLDFVYLLPDMDGYLCILGHSGCQSNSFRQLTSGLISSIADACQSLGLSLNAGIGTIVQDFWNLNHSYKSAVHALEYRFFFPHQNIFDGREALGSDLSVADFSDTKEDELIRLLCKKDTAAIDLWFQNFSDWLTQKFRTKNFAFIQIYSLLGRILKFFYELNLDTHDLEAKILYVYNHINEFHNTEELCQWLKDLCHLLCRKLDSSMNDYHQKLCELVISYINEHYTDNTLCLNDIAASANVSPAYLSALFKKNQGISLSDFITSQRISCSRPLPDNDYYESEGDQPEMWLCQSILFQHQLQKENGDHTFRLPGTAYITSSLLYNKVTGTNASALLRNFTYNQSIKRTIIFFRRRDRYEKMEKNPDISDNSLCTGHASGRIGNSAWHSLCYRGRSQDQFFQAKADPDTKRCFRACQRHSGYGCSILD